MAGAGKNCCEPSTESNPRIRCRRLSGKAWAGSDAESMRDRASKSKISSCALPTDCCKCRALRPSAARPSFSLKFDQKALLRFAL